MTSRRVPRWGDFSQLLRPEGHLLHPSLARLSRAADIRDLRALARRQVPRAVFDYVDGAAGTESSLLRCREVFDSVELNPRVLRDVSSVDTSTTLMGRVASLPFVFAPTGFTRMMHHAGEPAIARVAARMGIPYALSTLGTTSPEDLVRAAPQGDHWFQLYLWRDRAASTELLERVSAAGYRVLMLTVDTPVGGPRLRDVRNGMSIPPALSVRTILDGARHPHWWFNLLTTEPLSFASFRQWDGTVAELIDRTFDPTVTFEDLDWLRETWSGRLAVKGVQDDRDAKQVVKAGVDAVILSNHGGRQLDRAPVPLERLPGVLDAVGDDAEVYIDGGILDGGDIVAALARGARACLVGRAYLYGLMAGGEPGAQRAADMLAASVRTTMQLLGVRRIADLTPDLVQFRT